MLEFYVQANKIPTLHNNITRMILSRYWTYYLTS